MGLRFTKVEGAGNDLILLDARRQTVEDAPGLAIALCRRCFGVGGDGLLTLTDQGGLPLLRMYNPDGTEDFCGNALRCVAAYLHETGETASGRVTILTPRGRHEAVVTAAGDGQYTVEVEVVPPEFDPARIPVLVPPNRIREYPLQVAGHAVRLSFVSTGTTHSVFFGDDDVRDDLFFELSPLIERHALFPERTSVLWCRAERRDRIRMRIWERGVGETFACGSGACAAVVIGRSLGRTDDCAEVLTRGGRMVAEWTGKGPVRLTGEARIVYSGEWNGKGD